MVHPPSRLHRHREPSPSALTSSPLRSLHLQCCLPQRLWCRSISHCTNRGTSQAFTMVYAVTLTPDQKDYVKRFEDAELKYFYKVMTISNLTEVVKGSFAYHLEFPLQFLVDYAHEFTEQATVETKSRDPNSIRKWPLGITVRRFKGDGKTRVFAYGINGWRAFFEENKVRLGDLLVFQLVDFSRFRVYILSKNKSPASKGFLPSGFRVN